MSGAVSYAVTVLGCFQNTYTEMCVVFRRCQNIFDANFTARRLPQLNTPHVYSLQRLFF